MGQSLVLYCILTTVSGIASTITVTWTSCGKILGTGNITQGTTSLYYQYKTGQLTTDDQGKVYQCEVVINTNPPAIASSHITLNVNGKW